MELKKNLELQRDITFQEDGQIYSEGNRNILVPTSSFGILRKDLYENIGKERVKGFLIRYGSDLGRKDAETILKKFKDKSREFIIKIGPIYHQMQGQAIPKITNLKVEQVGDKISAYLEGTWEHSYEAIEHIEQFGIADEPVCYTLVGFASGFLTKICNQPVLFKEISCVGKGDEICKWVARTSDYWTEEMNAEIRYYHEEPIVKELELTYEKLLEERNYLKNVSAIYNELTEEVLKGKDLQHLMKVIYDYTKTPIIVESSELQPLVSDGMAEETLNEMNQHFKDFVMSRKMSKPSHHIKTLQFDEYIRLVAPIFLQGELFGYCSFIYNESEEKDSYFLQMVIERVSTICGLYLLNKKTEAEAENRMKGRFLEQLLNEEYKKEEILRRSSFLSLDIFQPYYMVVVHVQTTNQDYKEELSFLEEVMNETTHYFQELGKNILIGQQSNDLVLLFSESEIEKVGIRATCSSYLQNLSKKYPSVSFRLGISMKSEEIESASDKYHEALTSMRMTTDTNNVVEFQSLGILGSLINSNNQKEIQRIAMYTLRPLCDDLKDRKNLETIKTLYVYLMNGGNLEQTASDLALSLSGLRYRISKIEKLMDQDLRNPEVSYQLLLSIQALISIGKVNLKEY